MAKKVKRTQQRIPAPKKPASARKKPSFQEEDGKKAVLHIGWNSAVTQSLHSRFKTEEWQEIRLDQDPNVQPDFVAPLTNMKVIPDASVDAVWVQHVLQRFIITDIPRILKECFRVLKPMGYIFLSVPDGQAAAAYAAHSRADEILFQTPLGAITPMDLLYGFRLHLERGWQHQAHRCLFTADILGIVLRDSGFTNIRIQRRNTYDMMAVGYKFPYDHPDRAEKVEIISDANKAAPKPGELPAAPQIHRPVAQLKGKLGLPDELMIPPTRWKPLGLKKK